MSITAKDLAAALRAAANVLDKSGLTAGQKAALTRKARSKKVVRKTRVQLTSFDNRVVRLCTRPRGASVQTLSRLRGWRSGGALDNLRGTAARLHYLDKRAAWQDPLPPDGEMTMVPSKTGEIVGPTQMAAAVRFKAHDYYALTGVDLNDLAILAVRLNSRMVDGDELRDWQNRIALMLSGACTVLEAL